MNYKKLWRQSTTQVVNVMFVNATATRKKKLINELSVFIDFIDNEKVATSPSRDYIDSEFYQRFEHFGDCILESGGNGYRHRKDYFFHQLETCAILITEMLNPTPIPVALIDSGKAAILFGDTIKASDGVASLV